MTSSCFCWNELCDGRQPLDSRIYSNEILISKFTAKTTLKDLRIRFSVYGSIKDCYFVSHTGSDRLACIIFYNTNSAMNATLDKNYIFLHSKKLRVCNEMYTQSMKFDLKIVRDNTLHINELNDDCILHIFEFLSIAERIKLKSVCTRWRIMANESLRTIRHFDVDIRDFVNFNNYFDNKQQLMELLQKLDQQKLQTERSLLYYKSPIPSKVIASLNMHLLAVDCRNLTKLIIKCPTYDEHILSRILTVNKELRHIEILCNPYFSGESLIHLSEEIHTFIVENCDNLQSNHLCAVLKRLKNLKCLKLVKQNGCNVVNISNEYCQKLEILELNFCSYHDLDKRYSINRKYRNIFLPITNLRNLTDLQIVTEAYITETFLVNLSRNCQELRHLKLHLYDVTWRISERAINAIASLTKLEELNLQCTGINLTNLHGLHKINLTNCYDIQEEQVVSVIRNSPELRYLNIYGCHNITKNIFCEIKTISASRCNDVILELITGHFPSIPMKKCVIYNGKIY